jgi:2-oxoglutarate dehydrogenase E1 component
MTEAFTFINYSNAAFLSQEYERYLKDPKSVDPTLVYFFEGVEFGKKGVVSGSDPHLKVLQIIELYRQMGHRKAQFNVFGTKDDLPLEGLDLGAIVPTLGLLDKKEAPLSQVIDKLESIYCHSIGYEINIEGEARGWLLNQIEKRAPLSSSKEALTSLIYAEEFEIYLNKNYPYITRFSLEGGESFIPMMKEALQKAQQMEVKEVVLGMAHRGRLNFLANIMGKDMAEVFFEFEEDYVPLVDICYDLKYHTGLVAKLDNLHVNMLANPSHLESIDPVVEGCCRCLADALGSYKQVLPILIHGDAALSGQGVVYETLQMASLEGYKTGGTLHVVINNQIGYTAAPKDSRSTRYPTDIAKAFSSPVFHVSSEDVGGCLFVASLAIEMRQKFGIDLFIDYNCYRRLGHNEGDEVTYTNPVDYKKIKERPLISQIYKKGLMSDEEIGLLQAKIHEEYDKEKAKVSALKTRQMKKAEDFNPEKIKTAISEEAFWRIFEKLKTVKEGFHINPKLKRILDQQEQNLEKISWGFAENLALGSLIEEGVLIRLAGQDAIRGTFSSRHAGYFDFETQELFIPLGIDVYNSFLSEFAALGFELGYSIQDPKALVIWEAQYGDFFNGAQIIIDQYISALYDKWEEMSRLTLLLPHAMEGKGSEHSSARIERFLEQSANNNWQIVYPSTASQYFHVLRYQALKKKPTPLIVLTPKNGLRFAPSFASKEALLSSEFQDVMDDPKGLYEAQRVLLCTGHIYYDLLEARKEQSVAIIRIEQLYPLNEVKIRELLKKYTKATSLAFVQEEHRNQGAGPYILSIFKEIGYVSRPPSPVTAAGYHKLHQRELELLMHEAIYGN